MRLVCPSCEAKYEVPDDAIPDTGRDVQCANCGHAWFQMRARAMAVAPVAAEALVPVPATNPVEVAEMTGPDASEAPDAPDAQSDGPDTIPDAAQPQPLPEMLPELAAELAGGPDPVDWPSASDEALALALSTTDVTPEQGLDAALAIVPDSEDPPLVADGIAAHPSPDAMVDGTVSEPAPLDSAPEATTDDSDDAGPDSGSDALLEKAGSDTGNQTESLAVAGAVATGAAAYAVDESVLAILREEAEREATARRADAQALETQTDMDLAAGAKRKKSGAKVEAKPSARRDLLPDVEEINSTLRPSTPDADAEILGAGGSLSMPVRRGFRGGFLVVMTGAILCATLYILAPRLGAMLPALSDPLQAYVAFIDGFRLHLDGLMRSATVAINGN